MIKYKPGHRFGRLTFIARTTPNEYTVQEFQSWISRAYEFLNKKGEHFNG